MEGGGDLVADFLFRGGADEREKRLAERILFRVQVLFGR